MKTSEVLFRAAAYMEKHGKCSGTYDDSKGRVCAIGAINVAEGKAPVTRFSNNAAIRALSVDIVDDLHSTPRGIVTLWSDARDKRAVVTRMRKVARNLAREGK